MFVYEGTNPAHSTLLAFAKELGLSSFQYYAQPFVPYQILYNIKADFLLMTKFPGQETMPFQMIKNLPSKLGYVKLRNPGIAPKKNKAVSCGIVLDMFDCNGTNKSEEISRAIKWCQAKQSLRISLKFHPQILKRSSRFLDYHLKKIGLTSPKMVYRGQQAEFLNSVNFIVTNSESMIIQDALIQGIPVIFFSTSPSIYIVELYKLSPQLIRVCKDFCSFDNALIEFSVMSSKKRISGQKEFFNHSDNLRDDYPYLHNMLSNT